MTIKRRLFWSNILMVAIPTVLAVVFCSAISLLLIRFFEGWNGDTDELIALSERAESMPEFVWLGIAMLIVMAAIILATTVFLTSHLLKSITTPLNTLSFGVKQVRDGNLTFRLGYMGKDEFSPVCDDFNQMAARLEYLENARRKDEESRRELIAGISHDLRTPLTSIKAYLEGLEKGVPTSEEQRAKYFGIISAKANDLEHILEQLFLFCKLDMNEFPINLEQAELMSIAEMAQSLQPEYLRRGLRIIVDPVPEAKISIDPILFRNVLVNILENSVRYKKAETALLKISWTVQEAGIAIRLEDDGPGVPLEDLDKLFDAFYRSDPSRATKGNGLGLAISAKIIKQMGGEIRAELPSGGGLGIVVGLKI
ncbi:MAG: HAMP domain-containing histidine kinase [Clostridiales bacterium]|nr:HAMP domain-containing histidine kinase [Clostridiales bacterium]